MERVNWVNGVAFKENQNKDGVKLTNTYDLNTVSRVSQEFESEMNLMDGFCILSSWDNYEVIVETQTDTMTTVDMWEKIKLQQSVWQADEWLNAKTVSGSSGGGAKVESFPVGDEECVEAPWLLDTWRSIFKLHLMWW